MRELFSLRERLRVLAAVEAALARAQARRGIIPGAAADAIVAACGDLGAFDVDAIVEACETVGYPVVPLIEDLRRRAGAEAARYVHWGATTQDILDTALVLQIRAALTLLEDDVRATGNALAVRAYRHRTDVMAGRTHLQHALPITFGLKAAVWLAPLLEQLADLEPLRLRLLRVQFGGATGTLASLGEQARSVTLALAEELELRAADAPWHADRSAFATLASWVGVTSGALAKFAGDIVLLMQTEVGEVFEPHHAGRGGSSAMPQKRNPIASEYVLACTRGVQALVPLMLQAMQGDHERSTGAWQTEEIALPQLLVLASGAFGHARAIAEGMTVDTARMRANLGLTGGLIMAEAIAAELAKRVGSAEAHRLTERACARAIDDRLPLIDVLAADSEITRFADRARLDALMQPESYLGEAEHVVDRVLKRHAAVFNRL